MIYKVLSFNYKTSNHTFDFSPGHATKNQPMAVPV